MNETINAETTTTELITGKDIINIEKVKTGGLEQFKQYNAQIMADIHDLNLPSLLNNANEDNLKLIKKTRTTIRKETREDEERRKKVEREYNKQLNQWKEMYTKYVYEPRNKVDLTLKQAQDNIENDLRQEKTAIFQKMFDTKKEELKLDFVDFEDVNLNIQLSTPESNLKNELNEFFEKVQRDLSIIETNEEKNRMLVQYMKHLDLSKAMIDVTNTIELEKQLKERQKQAFERDVEVLKEKENTNTPKPKESLETFKVSFTVTGTKEEIISIRTFLKERGIRYD